MEAVGMTPYESHADVNDLTPPPRGRTPGAATAPSQADIVRASSTIQQWRNMSNRAIPAPQALLEAAETLSAALQAERTKAEARKRDWQDYFTRLKVEAIEPDPCVPHGIERPVSAEERQTFFDRIDDARGLSACLFFGGAVWGVIAWLVLSWAVT